MKRSFVVFILTTLIMVIGASVCFAANPIITNIFTADPGALVYNGKVYLYTGHDEAAVGHNGFVMNNWACFSSSDMINWTSHGYPLAYTNFSWAKGSAWASQVVYRDGKFYWYVCVDHKTITGMAIGVAVSTSPTGPFTDARGTALITNNMTTQTSITWDDIDPTVFIDDDGQAYMYWGNTVCKWVRLNSDMISISGSINTVSLPSFTEAPWLHKRNGIYYLSYAYGFPEKIAYATSNSPTGPWTYRGILNDLVTNCPTNHQAIVNDFNGKCYFVYHNGALPTGGEYRRSVCVDYLYYNADGTMQQVIQTTQGIGGPTPTPTPTPGATATPTPTGPTPTPGTGPVVWYKFDETSGTTAADSSGNGKNGTLVNGPTWVAGKSGNAVNLDGSNDYVSMPSGIVSSLNDFTIAAWVKQDALKTWSRIFDIGTGTTVNMFLTPSGGGTIRFAITTGGGGAEQRINGTATLPTGSWKHVAVTLAGNTGRLYVDGAQVGQNTSMTLRPSSLGNTTQNWIGRSMYSADPYLDGQVDAFRIYNRALSASEVNGLYTAGN